MGGLDQEQDVALDPEQQDPAPRRRKAAKIVAEGLYKVFGKDPSKVLDLLKEGSSKDEIFARTGLTVGVDDASFEIMDGEIFVLMGLSGSGKSTLLRMLNRLIEPTAGSVRVGDEDITEMDDARLIEMRRREMSMVFQSFALLPNRTVYENASFGLEVAGVRDDERRERTMDALQSVGLSPYADSLPQALSGGMQQRVGLARALATNPSILLMDEAFSALDPLIRTEMQDQLLDLQKEQARTVVFVSHDLDEALKIGDRIAVMEHGRIVQIAPPAEILRRPATEYVRAFFRGVDVSRVFTVGQIASRRRDMEIEDQDRAAGDALDELRKARHDLAVVLGSDWRLAGVVTIRSLKAALKNDEKARCCDAFAREIEPVREDTLLAHVLEPLARSSEALPVVDKDRRYVGLVSKTDMLRALGRAGKDGNHRTEEV
jgi:glycine betaine/proline transport system ATP-binding protein